MVIPVKFVHVFEVIETDLTGLNYNGNNGDNVMRLKKLRIGDREYPYFSAQAYRRWLKDNLAERGKNYDNTDPTVNGNNLIEKIKENYGLALFGYMLTRKGNSSYARPSPLLTSNYLGMFPLITTEIGTNKNERLKGKEKKDKTGNESSLWYRELTINAFRGYQTLEIDRIGVFTREEAGEEVTLDEDTVKEIITDWLWAVLNKRHRKVATRGLTDIRPKILAINVSENGVNPFLKIRKIARSATEAPIDLTSRLDDIARKHRITVVVLDSDDNLVTVDRERDYIVKHGDFDIEKFVRENL